MNKQYDITILGGGMVGLMLANLLLDQPLRIAIVDPQPPEMEWQPDDYPLRVSAINAASRQFFEKLDLWGSFAEQAATYDKMVVWDENSSGEISFDVAELGVKHLGAIVPNRLMRKTLWENLQRRNNVTEVTCFCPAKAKQFLNVGQHRLIVLDDGSRLKTNLVVGAEGSRSWLRQQLGITCKQGFYDQKGLVAVVQHENSHDNTAYQRFLKTGPLAFLPLAINKVPDEFHVSSIVWSCETDRAETLLQMDDQTFNHVLTEAIENKLGDVTLLSERASFPLSYHHAKSYVAPGAVLIGDAAHGIHPLAGQGVNLGYADAKVLAETIQMALSEKQVLSDVTVLKRYERSRRVHNEITLQAMTEFDQLFSNDNETLSQLRGFGLELTDKVPLAKRFFASMVN